MAKHKPTSRRRPTRVVGGEPLERRALLAGGQGVFAQIAGQVAPHREVGSTRLAVDAGDFTLPRDRVLLGLVADADGDNLVPGRISLVSQGRGATHGLNQGTVATARKTSMTLASLKPGDYSAIVSSRSRTHGSYNLEAFLAGDANADYRVDGSDLAAIRSLRGVRRSSARYLVGADVNRDGVINAADLGLARRNLGVSTSIRPIAVTAALDTTSDPEGDGQVTMDTVTVSGRTQPGALIRVDAGSDGTTDELLSANLQGDYHFTLAASPGVNHLTVTASDRFGQAASVGLAFIGTLGQPIPPRHDITPPTIKILDPATGFTTTNPMIAGHVTDDASGVASLTASVDSGPVVAVPFDAATGSFAYTTGFALDGSADGRHQVQLVATDGAGNASTPVPLDFTLDTRPPTIAIQSPSQATASRSDPTITGLVADATSGVAKLSAQVDSGSAVPVSFDASGAFRFTPALATDGTADGTHTARFLATDGAGLASQAATLTFRLDRTAIPDPTTIAPTLSSTTTTSLLDATSFLYTGPDAIQTGVAPGTITLDRAAVARGKVLDPAGNPLAGVTITVLGHPEFGQTYSRADGMLDLAVNGGGPLTVEYAKAGYLPVERQIDVPSQNYALLPNVAMIPPDSQVTTIDLASTRAFQVAQGSVESDSDGTRQATLLFPQGEQATMTLADGTTRPLASLNVRATEYTVGPNGPAAMPGTLPATTGYTYAVELSDDAAIAAGTTAVSFTKAVPFYLENFLNFPVGMSVPTGYYDRQSGQWVASTNGRVVKVLDETGGTASLDIDGSGTAATPAALAALGITDAERAQIAGLYAPGQSLWRVPVMHFTPYDYNWPVGPPQGAERPNIDPSNAANPNVNNPNYGCGSIIAIENQTLGESIPIDGTPFSLAYKSDRTTGGNLADRTLAIPLIQATVPDGLKRVDLTVSVGGRSSTQSFDPTPGRSAIFTWDGLDAYGRSVPGSAKASITIGYVYDGVYFSPAERAQVFGAYSSGTPLTLNRSRLEVTIPEKFDAVLLNTGTGSDALGGWALDAHNQYDPTAQVLHLGNGTDQSSTADLFQSIATVAGNGSVSSRGDGDLTTVAFIQPSGLGTDPGGTLVSPGSLAVGADGSIYIADSNLFIRKIAPDGIITTIAGNGTSGFNGDGGPAIKAGMRPDSLAIGPDGSLYIGDSSNGRVRRIAADGTITTVAGSGPVPLFTQNFGDGGPAVRAKVSPSSIAVAADGTLFIADLDNRRVRRVGTDGVIATVAGNGSGSYVDGVAATQSGIYPSSIALAPNGSLLIAERSSNRISHVGGDGIIRTLLSGGTSPFSEITSVAVRSDGTVIYTDKGSQTIDRVGSSNPIAGIPNKAHGGDGGPAVSAGINPGAIAFSPDGSLYLVDGFYATGASIRKIGTNGIINTVAGGGSPVSQGGDLATRTGIDPTSIIVSPSHDIYVCDTLNFSIRKIAPDGTIANLTIDGRQDGLDVNIPRAIALSPDGSLYIAEKGDIYHGDRIVRVDSAGTSSLFAGGHNPGVGFSGDGGPAIGASLDFSYVTSIAVSPDGSVFVADTGNHRVRRIGTDGIITTVAGGGNGGTTSNGDGGPAAQAMLTFPDSIALGPDGSLYIGDADRVRRVSPTGIIATVAGGGMLSGDGIPATQARLYNTNYLVGASSAVKIAVDRQGNLYIGEGNRPDIRFVGADGIITTIAGNGTSGYGGDGGAAPDAEFSAIASLAVDDEGRVFVADGPRIRELMPILPGTSADNLSIPSQDGSQVYQFDHTGRHLRTLDALTGALIYAFAYDPAGRLTSVTDGDGNVTTIERDPTGNPTAIVGPYGQRTALTLNAQGYLASVIDPADETTTLGYGAGGLLTSMADPLGNASSMTYDASGRLILDENATDGFTKLDRTELGGGSYQVTTTNAVNGTREYRVERLADGSLRRTAIDGRGFATVTLETPTGTSVVTDPNGTVTTTVLGPDPRFGMLAPIVASQTVKLPSGLTSTITATRTEVDSSSGGIAPAKQTDTVTVNGDTSTTTYDGTARTITSTSAAGRTSVTTLDAKGRVILVQVPGVAATSFAYDARGRLMSVTQGDRSVTYSYDARGNLESITDPLQRKVSFEYDAADRLIRQTQPDQSVITFAYDAAGNMIGLTPPAKTATAFGYDAYNRLTSSTPPATGEGDDTTRYVYNLAGQVIKETLPGGSEVLYDYCDCGRLNSIKTPLGTYGYTYSDTTGALTSLSSPGGSQLAYGYDGALLTSVKLTGPVTGTVAWAYNADFQITSETVNGGNKVTYGYDKDGLLTQAGTLTLTRDAATGFLTGTTLGTVTDTLAYNAYGEASTYQAKIGRDVAFEDDFTRDQLGRVSRKVETVRGVTTTTDYGYDQNDRLVTVTENGVLTQKYGYDANGNRLSLMTTSGTVTGTYDAQDRLLTYDTKTYSYTPAGQLLQVTDSATGETTHYAYDVFGNLTRVDLPTGHTVEYLTDGQDRRIGKKVDGKLTEGLIYSGQLQPVARTDGAGNIVERFVYGTGVNVPEYMVKGGVTYRFITDQLGSVRLVVNSATGAIAQRIDYDAFGKVLADTNPGFQPFGFDGGLYEVSTGLIRFGARDYDPETGKWTTADPTGFDGSPYNLYEFSAGDPMNLSDASGLLTPTQIFAGAEIALDAAEAVGFAIGRRIASTAIQTALHNETADDDSVKPGIPESGQKCPTPESGENESGDPASGSDGEAGSTGNESFVDRLKRQRQTNGGTSGSSRGIGAGRPPGTPGSISPPPPIGRNR